MAFLQQLEAIKHGQAKPPFLTSMDYIKMYFFDKVDNTTLNHEISKKHRYAASLYQLDPDPYNFDETDSEYEFRMELMASVL